MSDRKICQELNLFYFRQLLDCVSISAVALLVGIPIGIVNL